MLRTEVLDDVRELRTQSLLDGLDRLTEIDGAPPLILGIPCHGKDDEVLVEVRLTVLVGGMRISEADESPGSPFASVSSRTNEDCAGFQVLECGLSDGFEQVEAEVRVQPGGQDTQFGGNGEEDLMQGLAPRGDTGHELIPMAIATQQQVAKKIW